MPYALITGSAKRIGKEIALFLAKHGWDIIIHYNTSEDKANQLQDEVISLGRKCIIYKSNFLHADDYNQIMQEFKIGLLVNNASMFENDNLHNLKEKDLLNNLKVNFSTPLILSKALMQSHSGVDGQVNIINILDNIIFKLPKNFISYYFSKTSLANFTKLAAKLYAPKVRVNGIALGQIMQNPKQSEANFEKTKNAAPLEYGATVDEICYTIDFILKTKSLTGQIISLDGGSHLDNLNYP
ncbi:SDR family NAD(P)-dependent oxidoreductase [Candidatus Bandiella euplotis]|uniref:SDR family oxidoreductase n=1 Tax=Candidatus Bandiella euplotis TaxID=1664265 RepID=A0ABZ0UMJ7_9RICK|nr:SDR family NAD(P)-dependent oxidoreductase [Candidatus Bandiella woodruffii]WPX97361.1 SDR family oxidoreductase [Candidatus Bandiella woodruffii]